MRGILDGRMRREEAEVGFPLPCRGPSVVRTDGDAASHYHTTLIFRIAIRSIAERQTAAERRAGRQAGRQVAASLSIRVRSLPHLGPRDGRDGRERGNFSDIYERR